MDERVAKAALDAAEWDIVLGVTAGAFLSLLRVIACINLFAGDGPRDWFFAAQLLVQTVLAMVCTVGVWRRRPVAAIALAVLYGLGYFFSWIASGRFMPPLALIGVLVWYGLYRGIRGTRLYHEEAGRGQRTRYLTSAEADEGTCPTFVDTST